MKKMLIFIAALLIIASPAVSQVNWEMDKNNTEVQFKVNHMVITNVVGKFKEFDIMFSSNRINNFSNALLETVIRTESVFTDNEYRDNYLRSDYFLNVLEYPEISFVSKSFCNTGDNMYKVIGDLTIKDVTKEIELDADFSGPVKARGLILLLSFQSNPCTNILSGSTFGGKVNYTI